MKPVKHIIIGTLLIGMLYLATGCATTTKIFGKKSTAEASAKAKVENVESQIGANLQDKLEQAANLTYGVGYALSKEENPSRSIEVARELNSRAASLTGAPTIDEMNKMKQMIDDLTSQLQTEVARGQKALEAKDNEIYALQLESKLLVAAKDKEIQKYMKLAQDTAMKADAIQAKLDDMNSFFGLGAIWYGLKRLVVSLAWFIGIGSILYLVLRFASMSNPIAASIFGIFNLIGSWFVNIIKVLTPKAVEVAGYAEKAVVNEYKSIMVKLVDCIESTKIQQKTAAAVAAAAAANAAAAAVPNSLNVLSTELSKTLNTNEKAAISQIKQDIGYTG